MTPVIPLTPIFIDEVCELKHGYVTPHRIELVYYVYAIHKVRVKVVCLECEQEAIDAGEKTMKYYEMTFHIREWIRLLDAYYDGLDPKN